VQWKNDQDVEKKLSKVERRKKSQKGVKCLFGLVIGVDGGRMVKSIRKISLCVLV
jgi:hypothetical protein